jgi:ABC-2 type transport system permease protein
MKLLSVMRKSAKEQVRQFWILVLTVSMAPFFVGVYFLINEASQPHYDVLLLNEDRGAEAANYGALLLDGLRDFKAAELDVPITVHSVDSRADALERLQDKKADALIVIPADFTATVDALMGGESGARVRVEFVGDLTNVQYLVSALWSEELISRYVYDAGQIPRPLEIVETPLGVSGQINDFDLYVPGILILSVIMLMFSATIALVTEVEHQTMVRLKLSRVSALEFLAGVSLVQIGIGVVSVLLTLAVALALVALLASISIIAFSLIVAALTRTVNEVLVVGNFPLFLFMFFTGAAFPLEGATLFTVAGYPVTLQGVMSPTHAILAAQKVLILDMGLRDILPELVALGLVTLVYFVVGLWAFQRRHMRVE